MDQRSQRKQREYEARREEILLAAERMFSQNGFFKTSMAEIAESAQFAMGTVYRFFKSKEEIYISLVEAKVEELLNLLKEATKKWAYGSRETAGSDTSEIGFCGSKS